MKAPSPSTRGSAPQAAGFEADLRRLYPDLDADLLAHLGDEFEHVEIAGGDTLMREGEASDALYILMSGRLAASRAGTDGPRRIGEIGRGEMIGEMSLLGGGLRTATVTALRDARLVRISNQGFLSFMQRHPSVTRQFIQILIRRLASPARQDVERLSTIAVLGAHPGAPVRMFVAELRDALAQFGDALLVTREDIERAHPGCLGGPNEAHITAWLNEREQHHRLLVYVGEDSAEGAGRSAARAAPDAWSRLCVRQADRILAVADSSAAPTSAWLTYLAARGGGTAARQCELVRVHQPGVPIRDTAGWLDRHDFTCHHHAIRGDTGTLRRLARHLLGHSVGVVFGGGGARALAAVGSLRAMAEADIAVDCIGGSSMGAVVGAMAAAGLGARQIHDILSAALSKRPFSGLTLPLVSLLSGRRLRAMMHDLFGEGTIEDLPVRFFCTACNLTRGSLEVMQRGPLRRWVLASNAVPGIVPPVVAGGDLFVDGGLVNNVPADVARRINAGPVIAVNVSGAAPLSTTLPDDTDLSGWRLLLGGRAGAAPGLARILVRAMLLASANHAGRVDQHAALVIAPDMPGIDVADWGAIDRIVDAGYACSMAALETWDRAREA